MPDAVQPSTNTAVSGAASSPDCCEQQENSTALKSQPAHPLFLPGSRANPPPVPQICVGRHDPQEGTCRDVAPELQCQRIPYC